MQLNNKLLNIVFTGFLVLLFATSLIAREHPNQHSNSISMFAKPGVDVGKRTRTLSNIGNWGYWLYWDAKTANDPGGDSGGFYPRATVGAIFMDGLIYGGFTESKPDSPRVVGSWYRQGQISGWIDDVTGQPVDPNDDDVGIWRVRWDYQFLGLEDVRQDAADWYSTDAESINETQMQFILDQYAYDWENWPDDHGAPYYDVNGNGQYDGENATWKEVPDPDNPGNMIWEWQGVQEDLNDDGDITIGEREEPGLAKGDQIVYFVANDFDPIASQFIYGSLPLFMEMQTTVWAYNQPSATLGQMLFKKYLLINKGSETISEMYISQVCDPDVGDYADDLVGCDTVLNASFGYNARVNDDQYQVQNLPPPAAGYDFFQGPLVKGNAGEDLNKNGVDDAVDYGIFQLKKRGPGLINLPMTSFYYFAADSDPDDPDQGQYIGTLQFYNLLRGNKPTDDLANPSPFTIENIPIAEGGVITKFPLAGDPFRGTGDLDGRGKNLAPSDRRMGMVTGPYTMAPGDSQEVVVAVLGGIINQPGGNNLNAVQQLKLNSRFAQFMYDNLFEAVPTPQPAPKVKLTELDGELVLEWGSDINGVAATEETEILGFEFEGYNIYQLPTANASISQAYRIATFDLVNNVTTIKATKFVASVGDVVEVPIQVGTDSGIRRYIVIDRDYINDDFLFNGNSYYFAVTAYNYNPDPSVPEPSLESGVLPAINVIPQNQVPGVRYNAEAGEELPYEKEGLSDGMIVATVIDPAVTTGHTYEVSFAEDTDTSSATYGELLWTLTDLDDQRVVFADQQQEDGIEADDQVIFEGIQLKVPGLIAGVNVIQEMALGGTAVDPPDNVWHSLNSDQTYYAGAGGGAGGIDRLERFADYFSPRDFELRFTDAGGFGVYAFEDDKICTTPWEIWDIGQVGAGNVNDPSDDVRLVPFINNNDLTLNEWGWATGTDPYFGYPSSDWIYYMDPEGSDGYDKFAAQCVADGGAGATYSYATDGSTDGYWANFHGGFVYPIGRFIVCDFAESGTPPPSGTVIRLVSKKPNLEDTKYRFTVPAPTVSQELAKMDVEKINVFPNPYYAFNPEEQDQFQKFVTFNHLPAQGEIEIRIFDLSGRQVRKLEETDLGGQFLRWDLQNEAGLPVGSGMYIAYINMPDLGKEKILKVMIIQAQQQLKYF